MRKRGAILVAVVAGLVGLSVLAYAGWGVYTILSTPLAAGVQGCPSRAMPVRPGSTLKNDAEITVRSDRGGMTTCCWAEYDISASAARDVFAYYAEPQNVPGWNVTESYANTGYLAFKSASVPGLRADVQVTTMKQYFAVGSPLVTYAISVCICDPRSMAQ